MSCRHHRSLLRSYMVYHVRPTIEAIISQIISEILALLPETCSARRRLPSLEYPGSPKVRSTSDLPSGYVSNAPIIRIRPFLPREVVRVVLSKSSYAFYLTCLICVQPETRVYSVKDPRHRLTLHKSLTRSNVYLISASPVVDGQAYENDLYVFKS